MVSVTTIDRAILWQSVTQKKDRSSYQNRYCRIPQLENIVCTILFSITHYEGSLKP